MKNYLVVFALVAPLLTMTGWAQDTSPVFQIEQQSQTAKTGRISSQAQLDELLMTMAAEMQSLRIASSNKELKDLLATHGETMREAVDLLQRMTAERMRSERSGHPNSAHRRESGPDNAANARDLEMSERSGAQERCATREWPIKTGRYAAIGVGVGA